MAYIFSFQVYTYNGQKTDKSFIQENLFTRIIYHKIQSFRVCLSRQSTIQNQMKVYYILGFFFRKLYEEVNSISRQQPGQPR